MTFNVAADGTMFVRDYRYSSGADFRAAVRGMKIYYALAAPKKGDIPDTVDCALKSDDMGVQLLGKGDPFQPSNVSTVYTASMEMDIQYLLDAPGQVRNYALSQKMPNAPTTDGTYTLKVVVSGGVPSFDWVQE